MVVEGTRWVFSRTPPTSYRAAPTLGQDTFEVLSELIEYEPEHIAKLMASGALETYRRLKLDEALIGSIEGVLQSQLEYHLDRRLKSLAFLHEMRM